jgi:hypothetical protein
VPNAHIDLVARDWGHALGGKVGGAEAVSPGERKLAREPPSGLTRQGTERRYLTRAAWVIDHQRPAAVRLPACQLATMRLQLGRDCHPGEARHRIPKMWASRPAWIGPKIALGCPQTRAPPAGAHAPRTPLRYRVQRCAIAYSRCPSPRRMGGLALRQQLSNRVPKLDYTTSRDARWGRLHTP